MDSVHRSLRLIRRRVELIHLHINQELLLEATSSMFAGQNIGAGKIDRVREGFGRELKSLQLSVLESQF